MGVVGMDMDIRQGRLGDCWLIATILAMQVSPAWRKALARASSTPLWLRLLARVACMDKRIRTRLYDERRGAWQVTQVPLGALAQPGASRGDPAAVAIEAAAARMLGGYDRLDAGHVEDAVRMIVGPADASGVTIIDFLDSGGTWFSKGGGGAMRIRYAAMPRYIRDALRSGHGMAVVSTLWDRDTRDKNVPARHAFAVVGVDDDDAVVMRDPQGPRGATAMSFPDMDASGRFRVSFRDLVAKFDRIQVYQRPGTELKK